MTLLNVNVLRCYDTVSNVFFFFKQKTAYELRISDWSSDVCSSDLGRVAAIHPEDYSVDLVMTDDGSHLAGVQVLAPSASSNTGYNDQIGRASCRERVCPYV